MINFRKSVLTCLGWLLISELLCLVLSFSFAILRPQWIRWLSLCCGILAHCLLMATAGKSCAQPQIAHYRETQQEASPLLPFLLGLITAIPLWLLWGILYLNRDSSAMLNAFLLLNAPFIQYHRLIVDGMEPFSALTAFRQILTALPPIVTAASVIAGYQMHYLPSVAEIRAKKPRA